MKAAQVVVKVVRVRKVGRVLMERVDRTSVELVGISLFLTCLVQVVDHG